jgi:hypothetical protein
LNKNILELNLFFIYLKNKKMEDETQEMFFNKFQHDINCLSDSVKYNFIYFKE